MDFPNWTDVLVMVLELITVRLCGDFACNSFMVERLYPQVQGMELLVIGSQEIVEFSIKFNAYILKLACSPCSSLYSQYLCY